MSLKTCPDGKSLRQFLLGTGGDTQIDQWEAHLQVCNHCLSAADEMSADDDLIFAIESQRSIEGEEDVVDDLVERGKQLYTEMNIPDLNGTSLCDKTSGSAPDPPQLDFLAPPEQPDELGRLGGYRVLQLIGTGGMGIVFRAEDAKLERQVALKALKPSLAASSSAKERFLQEARATAAIEHDHIVHIYQVAEDRGIPFIAMQFLRGESLRDLLVRYQRVEQRRALQIGREVAEGLEAAHKQGLIHRDIKPDNIWIEEGGRTKILDFGLVTMGATHSDLTQAGLIIGTPQYMAPEQALDEGVDQRSDLFSLGSVLYRVVSGQGPFHQNNITATLLAVAAKDPVPVHELCPEIDPDFARLIMRLLSKDRKDRPASAAEVSKAIQRIERKLETKSTPQPLVARTSDPAPSPPKYLDLILSGIGVAVIVSVLFFGVWAPSLLFEVENEEGTLVVQITGNQFDTSVKGKKIKIKNTESKEVFTIDLNSREEKKQLKPGKYFILETASGLRTKTNNFTIHKGQKKVLEVTWEAKSEVAKGDSTSAKEPARHALKFDGQDDYVVIPTLKYDGSHPLTIEFIAQPSGKDDRMQRFVVSNGDYVDNAEQGFSVYEMGNTYPNPEYTSWAFGYSGKDKDRGSLTASRESWKPGESTHVAITLDGRLWKFFTGGKLWRQGELQSDPSSSNKPFSLGRHPIFKGYFRGQIEFVRISNVPRYSENFEPQKHLTPDEHTLALYLFEPSDPGRLQDSSGNGHHGKIYGAKWVTLKDLPAKPSGQSTTEGVES
jgi:serine/threonine protein kinase